MEKFSAFTHALDRHPQFLAIHQVISLPPSMYAFPVWCAYLDFLGMLRKSMAVTAPLDW
jgi:hypothetical protein